MITDTKLSDRATLQYFPNTSRPWQIVIGNKAMSLTDDEMTMIYVGQRAVHQARLRHNWKDLTQERADELLKQWQEAHNE